MTKTQIASILNNVLMANALPDGDSWVQIAEDLSNIEDYGTTVNGSNPIDLNNLKDNFVVTVKNIFIGKKLPEKYYGMVKNEEDFATTIQRIMMTGTYDAIDSHMSNLTFNNGFDYHDGKYYGADLNAKVYTKTYAFKIPYSISTKEWKGALRDGAELSNLVARIGERVENTITQKFNKLVKSNFVAMIDKAEIGGRVIHLVSEFSREYNPQHSTTPYTYDVIKADRDLNAMFNAYVKSLIAETMDYIAEPNTIYNDGSVDTFTNKGESKCVLVSAFAKRIQYMTDPIEYHEREIPVSYDTVTGWQTTGTNIVKSIGDVSKVMIDDTTDRTYTNIVGIIYDASAMAMSIFTNEVSSEYIGSEAFTNYFHHVEARNVLDERMANIVLALD